MVRTSRRGSLSQVLLHPTAPALETIPITAILFDGATGERTEIAMPPADQSGYYIGVRDAILGRSPLPVSPESAIAVMAVLETTFASGKEGRVLSLPLTSGERRAYQEREKRGV